MKTQQMLATKISMHYMMYHTWEGYDGAETEESAKISGDYFTLKALSFSSGRGDG